MQIWLDADQVLLRNLRTALPTSRGRSYQGIFAMCSCENGRLFLSSPEGHCQADEEICQWHLYALAYVDLLFQSDQSDKLNFCKRILILFEGVGVGAIVYFFVILMRLIRGRNLIVEKYILAQFFIRRNNVVKINATSNVQCVSMKYRNYNFGKLQI